MDYEEIFNSVFENAGKSELGCFLRNPDVPFEYCLKAIKRRRPDIGWRNRLAIAMRPDCPEETLVKMCRGAGERFGRNLIHVMKRVPDAAMQALYDNSNCIWDVMTQWYISDDLKRQIVDMLLMNVDHGLDYCSDSILDFLNYQCSLPEECLERMNDVKQYYRHRPSNDTPLKENKVEMLVSLMRQPCDEQYAVQLLDGANPGNWNRFWRRKLAANPSISEYVEMQLRVKSEGNTLEIVNELLDRTREARERYRRLNG